MKANKIVYSYSATVQMRQFEPAVFYGMVEMQVDPSDDPREVFDYAKKLVRFNIDEEIKKKKLERKDSYSNPDSLEKNQ